MNNNSQVNKGFIDISNKILSIKPVCQLSGEEFLPIGGKTLKQQVMDYFNTSGNTATTQFGIVLFDEKGIKSALHHGMSRNKAIAFAAIRPTLEKGVVILPLDYYNVHGKKQKTGMVAAPIKIKEEKYICIVEVIDNTTTNRLYAHEVFLIKNLLEDVADSIAVRVAETPVTHPQGEVAKVLKKYLQNTYSTKEILNYLKCIQSSVESSDIMEQQKYEKSVLDYEDVKYAIECNRNLAYKEVIAEGEAKGETESKAKEKLQIARTMLSMELDIATIVKATGLSEQDIVKLKKD